MTRLHVFGLCSRGAGLSVRQLAREVFQDQRKHGHTGNAVIRVRRLGHCVADAGWVAHEQHRRWDVCGQDCRIVPGASVHPDRREVTGVEERRYGRQQSRGETYARHA